jgi:reductive dehalogenase
MFSFSRRKRSPHLGKYPMEKIRRVDKPTTYIGNNVPRVPRRADFFFRAEYGDLGQKPMEEVQRFVSKYPLSRAMGRLNKAQGHLLDGEPVAEHAPIPDDPVLIAKHIKSMCYFLDADIVGICEMPEYAWYSHDLEGKLIEPRHKYAIVLLIDQGYDAMSGSSGDDWISSAQSYRAYLKGSTIAATVAGYIRDLGFDARAHNNQDSEVIQTPLVLLAGLGELSRIGDVVINPFLGPRFKSSVVTTNLPMDIDRPIDFGLQNFCQNCMKCARECPVSAISFGDKVIFNDYEIWKPNVEACTRYRVTNPGGSSCGRCMKVCPYNKPGTLSHKIGLWLAMYVPASHKFLNWLDDKLGYGERNTEQKWWFDIEFRGDHVVQGERTNQRDLRPGRKPPKRQNIPLFSAETTPPPGSRQPYPLKQPKGVNNMSGDETLNSDIQS